jgi:hypothetical protein
MAALRQLQEISDSGGLTQMDEANLQRSSDMAGQRARASREAVMQNMRQRGIQGSGLELVGNLAAEEAETQRLAQEGFDTAGIAQQRALQAMMQSGQMAGQMRGQEFGEQEAIARARDDIARFNMANEQSRGMRNVDRLNQIQMANADIANQNTGLQRQDTMTQDEARRRAYMDQINRRQELNTQSQSNFQNVMAQREMKNRLQGASFQDQMAKINAKYGAGRDVVGMQQQQTAQERQMYGGIGSGIGQMGTAYALSRK